MKTLITCPFGVSSLLGNELKRLGIKVFDSFERGTYTNTNREGIYQINLRSRIANKVYICVAEGETKTFDQLFDLTKKKENKRDNYINDIEEISISVISKNSQLNSNRTIQSIAHKAIIDSVKGSVISTKEGIREKHSVKSLPSQGGQGDLQKQQNIGYKNYTKKEILIHISNNHCQIFINTSGESLHKRGYRKESGEAPIKENIAAAMVLLSGWKFKKPLIDPMCGSGTILIEAAMIVKNIAPGLQRNFAFEDFQNFDLELFKKLKIQAKEKVFEGDYNIQGYDINSRAKDAVHYNAKRAGVSDIIKFQTKDIFDLEIDNTEDTWIVSNPPYGNRLEIDDIEKLYGALAEKITNNFGGIISSYFEFEKHLDMKNFSKKKLYNGSEECRFRYRKL